MSWQEGFPGRTGMSLADAPRGGDVLSQLFGSVFAVAMALTGATAARDPSADFAGQHPSRAARTIADWVVRVHDNGRSSFFIVDKTNARVS